MSNIQGGDELVKTITGLAEVKKLDITDTNGVTAPYTTKQVWEVVSAPGPSPDSVDVHTLDGFVDLVKEKLENIENAAGKYVAHVIDEKNVELIALTSDTWGRRLTLIDASPIAIDPFPFGMFLDQEVFAIQVAAKIADGGDKDYVLDKASSLTDEATTTGEDNGFTQGVTVKRGIRMKEHIVLKPRVTLAPYRTFPEVGQPFSEFVLRARSGGDGQSPQLELIEADGGKWKIDAVNEIGRYLRAAGLEIPVIS